MPPGGLLHSPAGPARTSRRQRERSGLATTTTHLTPPNPEASGLAPPALIFLRAQALPTVVCNACGDARTAPPPLERAHEVVPAPVRCLQQSTSLCPRLRRRRTSASRSGRRGAPPRRASRGA